MVLFCSVIFQAAGGATSRCRILALCSNSRTGASSGPIKKQLGIAARKLSRAALGARPGVGRLRDIAGESPCNWFSKFLRLVAVALWTCARECVKPPCHVPIRCWIWGHRIDPSTPGRLGDLHKRSEARWAEVPSA